MWPPPKQKVRIVVAIPGDITIDKPLREKTIKIGRVIRSLTAHRVYELVLFRRGKDDSKIITDLAKYYLTPPYLRKYIPLKDTLRYVGLLPPLRSPSHTVPGNIDKALSYGFREGILVGFEEGKAIFDIGLGVPAVVTGGRNLRKGAIKTLKLLSRSEGYIKASIVNIDEIPFYWKPTFSRIFRNLKNTIANFKKRNFLILATSKYGEDLTAINIEKLVTDIKRKGKVLILFGSPKEGLYEIAQKEGFKLEDYSDYILNFIPEQGVYTIRSEEAIDYVLSILNFLINVKTFKSRGL